MNEDIINFKNPKSNENSFNLSYYIKLSDDCKKTFYKLKFAKKIFSIDYRNHLNSYCDLSEHEVEKIDEEKKEIILKNGKKLYYFLRNSFYVPDKLENNSEIAFSSKSFAIEQRNKYLQEKIDKIMEEVDRLKTIKNKYL